MPRKKASYNIALSIGLVDAIDYRRGLVSRSAYIENVLRKAGEVELND